jgi:hypothetical protein
LQFPKPMCWLMLVQRSLWTDSPCIGDYHNPWTWVSPMKPPYITIQVPVFTGQIPQLSPHFCGSPWNRNRCEQGPAPVEKAAAIRNPAGYCTSNAIKNTLVDWFLWELYCQS